MQSQAPTKKLEVLNAEAWGLEERIAANVAGIPETKTLQEEVED